MSAQFPAPGAKRAAGSSKPSRHRPLHQQLPSSSLSRAEDRPTGTSVVEEAVDNDGYVAAPAFARMPKPHSDSGSAPMEASLQRDHRLAIAASKDVKAAPLSEGVIEAPSMQSVQSAPRRAPLQSSVSLPGAFSVSGPGSTDGGSSDGYASDGFEEYEDDARRATPEGDPEAGVFDGLANRCEDDDPRRVDTSLPQLEQQHLAHHQLRYNLDDFVLLQASLVTPEPPLPLVEAKAVVGIEQPLAAPTPDLASVDSRRRRKGRWIALAACALVLVAVAVTVGVAVGAGLRNPGQTGGSNTTTEPSFDPGSEQWESVFSDLYETLPNYTREELHDPQSAASQAWRWVNRTFYQDPVYGSDRMRRLRQRLAVAILFYGTGGSSASTDPGWLNASLHECHWTGTTCTPQGEIMQLLRSDRGLNGSIPREVSFLTALTQLDLARNSLTGSIPTELGLLTDLQYLDLGDNRLTGSLPSELGHLSALHFAAANRNLLGGSLPTELYALTGLLGLSLPGNALTGTLAPELGNWTNANFLDLQSNPGIGGTIPTQLGQLSLLTSLRLSNASVSGAVPTEVCDLLLPLGILVDLALDCDRINWTCPGPCGWSSG